MPVTLMDRLPLPNLKVYSAGSVMLLSVSVYYALSVTSDPNWRVNATSLKGGGAGAAAASSLEEPVLMQPLPPVLVEAAANRSRNLTEHAAEVMTFMMQEPLCMWTVINIAYCSLAVFALALQHAVFGKLRVSETQRLKDKFWNYFFYKFMFVFGVINVQYMDEVLLWCSWFTVVGFLQLLAQLCKDRFEYLSFSPSSSGWAYARLLALLAGVVGSSLALLAAAAAWGLPAGRDTFAFMAAECILVLISSLQVVASYVLQVWQADAAEGKVYYTHLLFDVSHLVVELALVALQVVWSQLAVSLAALVLLLQLRTLLHALRRRLRAHARRTQARRHTHDSYPQASAEEVAANSDNCAICWEPMKEARKLPCTHLFHTSCLTQWLQQDASCPTCRRALAPPAPAPAQQDAPLPPPPATVNHLFHFHGSRYVSWLPSFSVEVSRVRLEPPRASQLEAMARQVQTMFPAYPLAALVADLVVTRASELTIDNILEGRLPLPPAPQEAEARRADAAASTSTHAHTHDASTQQAAAAAATAEAATATAPELEVSPPFPRNSLVRESLLRRRKEALVASARRRYLQRVADKDPAPAAAAAPAPAAAPPS